MSFYKSTTRGKVIAQQCHIFQSLLLVTLIALTLSACQQTHQPLGNQNLLELHNQARQSGMRCNGKYQRKTNKLTWNRTLAETARTHSEDMQAQQQVTHLSNHGLSTQSRINASGYAWQSFGENLASGAFSDQIVFELWLNSPQHCLNMLNPKYTEMGAAQVNGYWTAIYASPK